MSRIGHAQINIPSAATVEFKDNVVTVTGNNITMTRELKEGFDVKIVKYDFSRNSQGVRGIVSEPFFLSSFEPQITRNPTHDPITHVARK